MNVIGVIVTVGAVFYFWSSVQPVIVAVLKSMLSVIGGS